MVGTLFGVFGDAFGADCGTRLGCEGEGRREEEGEQCGRSEVGAGLSAYRSNRGFGALRTKTDGRVSE